jgi:outer membrane protein OmpA-like peptidoglycan-associated protein
MIMNIAKLTLTTFLALSAAACADDPHRRAKIGAATGAVAGAVIGDQISDGKGKYYGAVVGAVAGAAVGNYMDKQHAEMQRQLAQEAARNELSIVRMSEDTLRVGIASDASFDVNSAEIRFSARQTYDKIAAVLKNYDKTVIHVVGHTDSDGSDAHNQGLSERRADAVAGLLADSGVPSARMRTEGRGEREPVASNTTADGRRRNRRVDIVIKTVVEGREQDAERPPPYLGV